MPRPDVTELIELGRDREAAELADATLAGGDRSRNPGGPMDVLDQFDQIGPLLAGVVGGLSPADLDKPTPCDDFTVRGVLEHMVGGATAFAAAYRGTEPAEPATAAGPDDVLAGFGPALGDLAAAIHEPGALDRQVAAPFGTVPGDTFARFVVLDGLIHGWDMATATGQAYDPPAPLITEVEAFARQALDPLRDGQTFGPAVEPPAAATPMERLAAYSGRSV